MIDKVIEINYDIITNSEYEVEFDDDKNHINITKHDVSFEEAVFVFDDENAVCIADSNHSTTEERFVMLGISNTTRLLVVVYCMRNNRIRIISARKANKNEERIYSNQKNPR